MESLIGIQLNMQVTANMNDLEEAIVECSNMIQVEKTSNENSKENEEDEKIWPPNMGECIIGLFTDVLTLVK